MIVDQAIVNCGVFSMTCMETKFCLTRVAASVGVPPCSVLALKRNGVDQTQTGNRDIHLLFDTARFTHHIEAAYATMWKRYQDGEPPAAFAAEAMPDGSGNAIAEMQRTRGSIGRPR